MDLPPGNNNVISFSSAEFANFAAVLNGASNSGGNVMIAGLNGDVLTLIGVNKSALVASEFSFHT